MKTLTYFSIFLISVLFACNGETTDTPITENINTIHFSVSMSSPLNSTQIMSFHIETESIFETVSGKENERTWSTKEYILDSGDSISWALMCYDQSELVCHDVTITAYNNNDILETMTFSLGIATTSPMTYCKDGVNPKGVIYLL